MEWPPVEKADPTPPRLSLLAAGLLTAAIGLTGALAGWAQGSPVNSRPAVQALMWQRDHLADRPWTLLSMHLVHGSASHALGNLVVMWMVVWITAQSSTTPQPRIAHPVGWWQDAAMNGAVLMLAAALASGALWAWPAVQWGFGLSGVLHTLLVWLALDWLLVTPPHSWSRSGQAEPAGHQPRHLPVHRRRHWLMHWPGRWPGGILLGGMVARLAWEASWLQPIKAPTDGGMAVLAALHVSGAWAGLITWPVRQRWRRQRAG
jgi:membrane associated rhomboid family serine protease